MDKRKLFKLIKRNEGEKLDFKESMSLVTESDKRELVKDISAIANSKGGRGYIIIGIEDKTKKIVGCTCENVTEERVQQIVTSRCEPPIPIALDEIVIDKKKLFVITIYNGYQKPYQVRRNGAFYIRRGSTTDIMRKQELISSFQEGINFSIETLPITRSDPKVLNIDLIKRYFKLKGVEFTEDNKDFLLNISGITIQQNRYERPLCTLGGLLVFSDINSIYIPHNMIRVTDKTISSEHNVTLIQGTLIDMIYKSERVLNNILSKRFPTQCILELIKSSILYRDYLQINNTIEVIIKRDRIKVICPGKFIKKNKSSFISYARRNMWIYEKLVTLDVKNKVLKDDDRCTIIKKSVNSLVNIIYCKENEYVIATFLGLDDVNINKKQRI